MILHSMSTYLFNDTNYEGLVYSCGNYVFTYLKALYENKRKAVRISVQPFFGVKKRKEYSLL